MNSPSNMPVVQTSKKQDVEHIIVRGAEWQISGSGGLTGGKGKGKGQKGPVEDRNSLRSIAYANVLYLLSEGELAGYPSGSGLRDIYLDDTPIQNPNGSFNFTNIQIYTSFGTQTQTYIPGFNSIVSQVDVSTKATYDNGVNIPVTRTLNDINADAVSVTVLVPQLQEIDAKTGDIHGSSVRLQILISQNGGAFVPYVDDTIAGKTSSNYARSYRINLPKPGPWQIRLTRVSFGSTEQRITNDLYFQSFTSIIEAKLNYPFSALLGLQVSAEQFKSLPVVSVKMLGMKIQYPSNYNPNTRIYSGTWNGTFAFGWSNNPAWVLYDLLTNDRFGCGKFITASQIDKWSFYQIAQYCDGLVPDGKGGYEPRFTCNCYVQNRDDAYNMINAFASVFRGMTYWSSGTVFVAQDAPAAPVRLFTEANVKQEVDEQGHVTKPTFTYAGSSAKARHTVALVTYNDPNDSFTPKVVYVEDRAGINRYGYRETQITAFGCTSIGQAYRAGKWLLYTEQNETETVAFTTGVEGLLVRPGEIIKVADPLRAGTRMGGRLLGVGLQVDGITTALTLDATVTLTNGIGYTVSILDPSTGTQTEYILYNGAGDTNTLLIRGVTNAPVVASIWILNANNLQPQLFRVISVTEKSRNEYDIVGTSYNPSKYSAVEQNTPLISPPISRLPNLLTAPNAPSKVTIAESLYQAASSGVLVAVDITFQASTSSGIDFYQVEVRNAAFPTDPFTILGTTSDLTFKWLNVNSGIYDFRVQAVNKFGYRSEYQNQRYQVFGKNKPPGNVTNFTATASNQQILLKWDSLNDLDIQAGGLFKIKFTSSVTNVSWSNGFDVTQVSGASTSVLVPAYTGTYQIKAVSPLGYESVASTSVDSSFAATAAKNVVLTLTENPNFTGNKTNTVIANGFLQLGSSDYVDIAATSTEMIDDTTEQIDLYAATFDLTPGNIDTPGDGVNLGFNVDDEISTYDIVQNGSYEFSQILDLGGKYLSSINASLSSTAANLFSNIDSTGTDFIDDTAEQIDGAFFTGATANLLIASSNDGISYSNYQNFTVGSYLGRYFKFRVDLATTQQNYNVLVDMLSVTIDMPDRVETNTFNSSATAASTINYPSPFRNSPVVGITLVNGATGDYYALSNQTQSGFTVSVFNASGTRIVRSVNWIAKGFGTIVS